MDTFQIYNYLGYFHLPKSIIQIIHDYHYPKFLGPSPTDMQILDDALCYELLRDILSYEANIQLTTTHKKISDTDILEYPKASLRTRTILCITIHATMRYTRDFFPDYVLYRNRYIKIIVWDGPNFLAYEKGQRKWIVNFDEPTIKQRIINTIERIKNFIIRLFE